MKLVVGLGNPGRKYQDTRHNIGYHVLGELARKFATSTVRNKFHGEVVEANLSGAKALLLSPTTYMNRSGTSVQAAKAFFKISNEDLVIVCDDLNLPLAKLRFRAKGSSGGQKGLADIIRCLATEEFPRLRIGVGTPPPGWSWPDFVLSKFNKTEIPEIEDSVRRAAEAVLFWTREGIQQSMNRYN